MNSESAQAERKKETFLQKLGYAFAAIALFTISVGIVAKVVNFAYKQASAGIAKLLPPDSGHAS